MTRRRGITGGNVLATLFTLIVVVVLGIFYSLTGGNPGGSVDSPTAAPPVATPIVDVPPAGEAWWEVYFTDPLNVNDPAQWQNSIEGRLISKINAAQTSIHIASFEFDLTPVAEALIAAKQRGVDVRWVTDDESGLDVDGEPGHGQFAMLKNAGIEVRADTRSALMHNKFWIFDGQILWTGSTNITENGIFKQNNNTLIIHSPQLALIYEREFQEMWDGQFGPKSPSQLGQQSLTIDGLPILVAFAPEDSPLVSQIIPVVKSAGSNIRFLAFSFTDFPLAEAMIQRAQDGVNVMGVFEKVGSDTEAAELKTLFCAGVPVRRDGNPSFMHNKVIVIDERIVVTGSLNYSTNAEESNDENVIIIDNREIAKLYMQEFERIWGLGSDPESVTCP